MQGKERRCTPGVEGGGGGGSGALRIDDDELMLNVLRCQLTY